MLGVPGHERSRCAVAAPVRDLPDSAARSDEWPSRLLLLGRCLAALHDLGANLGDAALQHVERLRGGLGKVENTALLAVRAAIVDAHVDDGAGVDPRHA